MADTTGGSKKPGKVIRDLSLTEIEDGASTKRTDDDDDWGNPADIPDRPRSAQDLDDVSDIRVNVSAVLGRTSMSVDTVLKLGRGAVIELNRKVGEPVDVYLNDRLVARGEVVVVDDKLGITMTEIIKAQKN